MEDQTEEAPSAEELCEDFRRSMQAMASTVAVVTTDHLGTRGGLTATAVCSVSMAPPMILVCVNSAIHTHRLISLGEKFCVNLLSEGQAEVAAAFARATISGAVSKFDAAGQWISAPGRPPELDGALANIDCDLVRCVDVATHTIFIGEVRRAYTRTGLKPLLYSERCYQQLAE